MTLEVLLEAFGGSPMSRFAPSLLLLVPLLARGPAAVDNAAAAGPIDAAATFHAAGLRLAITGDANRNASAAVQFRRKGETSWREALPLARIAPSRFAGSIFDLDPGTAYEARVRLADPDGPAERQPEPASFTTRAERFPSGSGRTWYVREGAAGSGGEGDPLGSIQAAVERAAAGDVIEVMPGTYRESVAIAGRKGRSDAFITLRGRPGAQVRGTLAELESPKNRPWRSEEGGLFSAAVSAGAGDVGYIAAREARLYRWSGLDELRRKTPGVSGGYFWSAAERRLYVVLPDGADPNDAAMHVAHRGVALRFEKSDNWIVEGLDLGYFGAGDPRPRGHAILIESSSNVVVRRNRIHHVNQGVATSGSASTGIVIEDNEIFDTSIAGWPWDRVKATEAEGSAVALRGGPGQVVRRNRIRGTFNGVAASTWGALEDETRNTDLDIYENDFADIGDDPVEPEGTCINVRILRNRMRNCLTVVSLAPITVGPTYVVRNASLDHWLTAVKLNVGADNTGIKYVLHNTFVTRLRERRLLDGSTTSDGVSGLALWLHRRESGAPQRADTRTFGWANGIFLNNIVQATRLALEAASLKGPATFDYNILYSTAGAPLARLMGVLYPDIAALQAAGHEAHGSSAEPRFVDLAGGDLRLAPRSPGIDRGKRLPNVNDGFGGAAPDLGAFEAVARR